MKIRASFFDINTLNAPHIEGIIKSSSISAGTASIIRSLYSTHVNQKNLFFAIAPINVISEIAKVHPSVAFNIKNDALKKAASSLSRSIKSSLGLKDPDIKKDLKISDQIWLKFILNESSVDLFCQSLINSLSRSVSNFYNNDNLYNRATSIVKLINNKTSYESTLINIFFEILRRNT